MRLLVAKTYRIYVIYSIIMSFTQTTAELSKILNDYYNSMGHIYPDIERLKNLLSQVSYAQRCELLSSLRGDEVLIEAARQ